ncbi:MAG: hypothetical protein J7604_12820 [Sporocytophaga sp.]|uniref:hypothetical protein n=1 Tax=Sporocytophaga sp. TaxID=2231183 RepID=UPI001B0933D1|nr:hypothetical protein [Sporocytophaga sp.]MBO9701086.1 hypothetical protein [Sporocytophaga sp.]
MNQKKIKNVLDSFQEGVIEEMSFSGSDLNIKLECKFLAQEVNSTFQYFYCVLKSCTGLHLRYWDDEDKIVDDPAYLSNLLLELLGLEPVNETDLKVYVNCTALGFGGNLYFSASDIIVFDEDFRQMDPEELLFLSDRYWTSLMDIE